MTACPTCRTDPCGNPSFCRACRAADRRKARGEQPRYASLHPVPPPIADLPKADLSSKNWKEIAAEAWTSPSWKQAALEYHHARGGRTLIVETPPEDLARLRRLMSNDVSLERDEINRAARERYNEAPKATYDAAVYELRYGLPQLKNPNCQRRLSDLSAAQLKNLIASLQQRRGQFPNVSDELLTTLATIYDARVMSDGQ
jgi:hypothetical protein